MHFSYIATHSKTFRLARGSHPRAASAVSVTHPLTRHGPRADCDSRLVSGFHLRARARAGVIFSPLLTRLSIAFTPRPAPTRLAPTLTRCRSRPVCVSCHVSHVTPRALRAGPRVPARGAQTGPPRARQTDKHSSPHGACQLGEGQAVSSLAFERRLSHSLQLCSRTTRLHACASAPRGSNCGPSHTV